MLGLLRLGLRLLLLLLLLLLLVRVASLVSARRRVERPVLRRGRVSRV